MCAEGLPVGLVPEQFHVATMRNDVINYVGGLAAHDARWVLGEVAFSSCFPFTVITTLAGAGAFLIKCSLALAITGNDVLTAHPRSQDTSTGSN
ncbi:hypothetical protein ASF03_02250 [Rhizobium sp. Leaf68]|nr:hypothetical protein ASE62_02095 [Rhizobium sp. Leaf202]KQN87824.1 hypothetical protein ASF03_02250 [Rhizobium sp. Leaf68]